MADNEMSLKEQQRKRDGEALRVAMETARERHTANGTRLTPEEIKAEIKAYRQEKRKNQE